MPNFVAYRQSHDGETEVVCERLIADDPIAALDCVKRIFVPVSRHECYGVALTIADVPTNENRQKLVSGKSSKEAWKAKTQISHARRRAAKRAKERGEFFDE